MEKLELYCIVDCEVAHSPRRISDLPSAKTKDYQTLVFNSLKKIDPVNACLKLALPTEYGKVDLTSSYAQQAN